MVVGRQALSTVVLLLAALDLLLSVLWLAGALGQRLSDRAAFTGAASELTPVGRRYMRRFKLTFLLFVCLMLLLWMLRS
jgi:hypothetical protein